MICYARQVEENSGWDQWIQYPFPPGYSSVGEVTDVGPGVRSVQPGATVCSSAPHREWFIDRADRVILVPPALRPEQAAWFQLNIIVQNGIRETKPELGETAVVVGLGPLGQVAVRLLGVAGLRDLIAIDPLAERCALADGHGPTEVWNGSAPDLAPKLLEQTGKRGADMVFDITGNAVVFHAAHRMLAKRGRLGLIGDVPFPRQQTLTSDVINKGVAIVSAHGSMPPQEGTAFYRWGRREMCDFFFHLLLCGRVQVDNLVTHRIVPEDGPRVYREIGERRAGFMGVVIDWRKGVA
jgi:threonine dehydrogenase-like Zn-dependent dehydrogenase